MHLVSNPMYGGAWYNARTWWTDTDKFKLNILCEADREAGECADALGRPPASLVYKARELNIVLPDGWAQIVLPKRKSQRKSQLAAPVVNYPYISKVRDEHADLMAVNAIIPKGITDNMRADICQEVMLAILEGRTTIEALKAKSANASYFIKKFYHDNYEAGGHAISFNATDEDWDSDAIASSIAAKEWRREEYASKRGYSDAARRTFTAPSQFEAAWKDQAGRLHLRSHELEQFLSFEEIEEMMEEESVE